MNCVENIKPEDANLCIIYFPAKVGYWNVDDRVFHGVVLPSISSYYGIVQSIFTR